MDVLAKKSVKEVYFEDRDLYFYAYLDKSSSSYELDDGEDSMLEIGECEATVAENMHVRLNGSTVLFEKLNEDLQEDIRDFLASWEMEDLQGCDDYESDDPDEHNS